MNKQLESLNLLPKFNILKSDKKMKRKSRSESRQQNEKTTNKKGEEEEGSSDSSAEPRDGAKALNEDNPSSSFLPYGQAVASSNHDILVGGVSDPQPNSLIQRQLQSALGSSHENPNLSRNALLAAEINMIRDLGVNMERSRSSYSLSSIGNLSAGGGGHSSSRESSSLNSTNQQQLPASLADTRTRASSIHSAPDSSTTLNQLLSTPLLRERILLGSQFGGSGLVPSSTALELEQRRLLEGQLQAIAAVNMLQRQQQQGLPASISSLGMSSASTNAILAAAAAAAQRQLNGLSSNDSTRNSDPPNPSTVTSSTRDSVVSLRDAPALLPGASQQFIGSNNSAGNVSSLPSTNLDLLSSSALLRSGLLGSLVREHPEQPNPPGISAASIGPIQQGGGASAAMLMPQAVAHHRDQAYYTDRLLQWDVLCARGGASNHHPGNKRYRQLVNEMKAKYQNMDEKSAKTDLSRAIVDHVSNYGGRFVKFDKPSNKYYVLSAAQARKKVAQALRETKQLIWTMKI
jgi:hypothetical protein